jgi:hypothetical protein
MILGQRSAFQNGDDKYLRGRSMHQGGCVEDTLAAEGDVVQLGTYSTMEVQ